MVWLLHLYKNDNEMMIVISSKGITIKLAIVYNYYLIHELLEKKLQYKNFCTELDIMLMFETNTKNIIFQMTCNEKHIKCQKKFLFYILIPHFSICNNH